MKILLNQIVSYISLCLRSNPLFSNTHPHHVTEAALGLQNLSNNLSNTSFVSCTAGISNLSHPS